MITAAFSHSARQTDGPGSARFQSAGTPLYPRREFAHETHIRVDVQPHGKQVDLPISSQTRRAAEGRAERSNTTRLIVSIVAVHMPHGRIAPVPCMYSVRTLRPCGLVQHVQRAEPVRQRPCAPRQQIVDLNFHGGEFRHLRVEPSPVDEWNLFGEDTAGLSISHAAGVHRKTIHRLRAHGGPFSNFKGGCPYKRGRRKPVFREAKRPSLR